MRRLAMTDEKSGARRPLWPLLVCLAVIAGIAVEFMIAKEADLSDIAIGGAFIFLVGVIALQLLFPARTALGGPSFSDFRWRVVGGLILCGIALVILGARLPPSHTSELFYGIGLVPLSTGILATIIFLIHKMTY